MIGTLALLLINPVAVAEPRLNTAVNEMATAQRSCGLDGVTYMQFGGVVGRGYALERSIYVLIPSVIYARRKEALIAAGINCSAQIAADYGYKPIVLGTKN